MVMMDDKDTVRHKVLLREERSRGDHREPELLQAPCKTKVDLA